MASSQSSTTQTTDISKRIITHMNADHTDSLTRYLEHFHQLSSHAARHALLKDITLSSLHITTASTLSRASIDNTYTIVLSPPMASFAEARARVVALDAECRLALGRSDITIKRYLPPKKPFHIAVLVACVLTFILLHRRANLDPATAPTVIKKNLVQRFPKAFAFFYRIQPQVFYPMLAIHIGEAWWMDRSRLRVHSVPRGGWLWWRWIVNTFLEGFGNFQRFDALVASEKRKMEKAKH